MLKILRSTGALLPCSGGTERCDLRKVDDDDVQIVLAVDLHHFALRARLPSIDGVEQQARQPIWLSPDQIIWHNTPYVNTCSAFSYE